MIITQIHYIIKNEKTTISSMLYAVVTLANFLHIFFDSYSANIKYQCNRVKNKRHQIKANYF